jgi:hypothetical protein
MSSRKSLRDAPYLRKVVGLSIRDAAFRKAILDDPEKAISDNKRKLRFGPEKISTKGLEVIQSFTSTELDTLAKIYEKAKKSGVSIEPPEMF